MQETPAVPVVPMTVSPIEITDIFLHYKHCPNPEILFVFITISKL